MKIHLYMLVLSLFFLVPAQASAQDTRINMAGTKDCPLKETATLNIRWDRMEIDLSQAQDFIPAQITKIQAISEQMDGVKMDVQSSSYNVNTRQKNHGNCDVQEHPTTHELYGNLNLTVEPGEKAADLMGLLVEKGYKVNLNVNAYKRCQ